MKKISLIVLLIYALVVINLVIVLSQKQKKQYLGASMQSVVSSLPLEVENLATDLIAAEVTVDIKKENYKQVLKTVDKDSGYEYWVDEYVAPTGKGYQVYLKKPDGSIKSFGEGVEAIDRSFDWTTTTSTVEIIK
jgi:hypothetical protein